MTFARSDRRSCIYAIVNLTNGNRYFGSTVDAYRRFRGHRLDLRKGTHHCGHLQRAWAKYGEEAFAVRILAVLERAALHPTESRLLAKHVGRDYCYNSGTCADAPSRGTKASPETRARMSATAKGRTKSAEHRAKIGAAHKGRVVSAETCARISEYHSRPDVVEKTRATHTGRKRSDETRAKQRAAARARWTLEAREAFGAALSGERHHWSGRRHTPDSLRKMSESRRLWWSRQAVR